VRYTTRPLSDRTWLGSMGKESTRFKAKWGSTLEILDREIGWLKGRDVVIEALRAVDRYGATETGQQYTGFKALPAGRAMPASHMTRDDALALLWEYGRTERDAGAGTDLPGSTDPVALARYLRNARAVVHPDRHDGRRTLWDQVEQAALVLGVAS
jgi:hypothetical protein